MRKKRDAFQPALDAAMRRLHAAGDDIHRLDERSRTLLLVHAARGLIDNGGLRYFFERDFPNQPEYGVFTVAYRRVGALEAAARLEEAVALLGLGEPHRDADARDKAVEGLLQDKGGRFAALDRALCGDERVWDCLERFAAAR